MAVDDDGSKARAMERIANAAHSPPVVLDQSTQQLLVSELLDPNTLNPATNTGALPDGQWHTKNKDDKSSESWKGYQAFSAPDGSSTAGK